MALTDVPGIGPATAQRLHDAGIVDEAGLARCWPDEVVAATGRSYEQATAWIEAAKDSLIPTSTGPAIGERKQPGLMGWDVLLGLDLGYLALNVLGGIILAILILAGVDLASFTGGESGETDVAFSRMLLWLSNTLNLVTFGLVPLLWVAMTRVGGWKAIKTYLGMHWHPTTAIYGALLGVGMAFGFGALAYLLDWLGLTPESAPIDGLVDVLNWPLIIATSAVAGFAEEIMFRGVLQKWLRWWGQGLAFGILHVGNAGLLSFAITAIIGVGFGFMRHRGASLWLLIIAHFVYDLVLFSAAYTFPEAAGGEPGFLMP